VISSMDVYRAFGAAIEGQETDPVPLDEDSPVRSERYPYRDKSPDRHDYDKLDVEDVYRAGGATSLRLPMVYGPRDYQLREEFILRRVRAGRPRIPFGAGTWLACRGYVGDIARRPAGIGIRFDERHGSQPLRRPYVLDDDVVSHDPRGGRLQGRVGKGRG